MSSNYGSTKYGSVPSPSTPGYGNSAVTDFANPSSGPPQGGQFTEEFDASQRGSSLIDGPGIGRSSSRASTAVGGVSRNNTLKKKTSVKRMGSLRRSGSKKSMTAGSIRGVSAHNEEDFHSAFFTPVPTTGTPTEVLANRFQAWRSLLKSLITYFREIQSSYEARAKAVHKVQNTLVNMSHPSVFLSNNGLGEAARILEDYHKHSMLEAKKSEDIENDVIGALSGLRADLGQKIKEIKSLSGDFKNSVEKEKENTRREVEKLKDALQHAGHEDAVGKNDPYVVRLGVERAIERQLDEENYLHRAYLNLESSGRELEAIVVGEIQKAYNALAGILKREGDDAYAAVEGLRTGPIAMPKDEEWHHFVTSDPHFVDPDLPLRRIENIEYPGRNHPQATEIRAGMLERKSKYLKSYTPGWYVLSATHLHEFKSADKIYTQPPVMSLYLLDQKLGSHSDRGSSSHKFMLKGKQSGGVHKGHNWVFRAESFETMMAWFEDIRVLTEKTGEERNAFVRKHARSVSGTSERGTVSSDGLEDDEADRAPYSADVASLNPPEPKPQRPQPGGRFPSDLALRTVGTMPPTDGQDDSDDDRDVVPVPSSALSGSAQQEYAGQDPYRLDGVRTSVETARNAPYGGESAYIQQPQTQPPQQPIQQRDVVNTTPPPVQTQTYALPIERQPSISQEQALPPPQQPTTSPIAAAAPQTAPVQTSTATPLPAAPIAQQEDMPHPNLASGEWEMPIVVGGAAAAGGVGAGVLGAQGYQRHQEYESAKTVPVTPLEPAEPLNPGIAIPILPTSGDEKAGAGMDGADGHPIQTTSNTLPVVYAIPTGGSSQVDDASSSLPRSTPAILDDPAGTKPAKMIASSTTSTTKRDSGEEAFPLGGNEKEGAHLTGQLFPRVIRHDTSLSVSKLHVPGEFK
ncbi:unnamed protein product [Zymoseptoria tritici ST99CH_1A5]|uniref:PH domain-containing protein n=1 Tax=Zymoseptoria tritici ST99CH_1A5 TaxID=1276529 RepID=A0A1Y6LZT5_ZYMTR|nr:unnamed protein product [Zymoseptoria tritici ST99CH_1A5]